MVMLNKISLEGYKSIRECRDLRLEKLNVLIGANGSGKSNFLSFFKLLDSAMNDRLQDFIGRSGMSSSLLHFGPKVTNHISAELDLTSDLRTESYWLTLVDAAPATLIFAEESFQATEIMVGRDKTFTVPGRRRLGSGHRESALLTPALADNSSAKFIRTALSRFQCYQFHDTSSNSPMRNSSDLFGPSDLLPDGANLPALLRNMREYRHEYYLRVVETVRLVFPLFKDFFLEPYVGGGNFVMLRWKATDDADYVFGPHQISDGTLRFIALVTLLLQPRDWLPPLIAIDEPELGLHPYAIKILSALIQDTANFTQIIVATQSPALVDEVEIDAVIVADMVDGATKLERLSPEKLKDWLDEYTLSELWEKNVIGGRP